MNDFNEDHRFEKLEKTVEELLIHNNLEAVLYFSKIQKHWSIIVGEPLAAKTHPSKLHKKKLFVTVEDAAYSHHLKYFERHILDLIASPEICGEGVVYKVVFQVGKSAKEPAIQKEKAKMQKTTVDPAEDIQEVKQTAEAISDRKLKASFRRFMARHFPMTPSDKT